MRRAFFDFIYFTTNLFKYLERGRESDREGREQSLQKMREVLSKKLNRPKKEKPRSFGSKRLQRNESWVWADVFFLHILRFYSDIKG